MKITKEQLKQIIQEEIEIATETYRPSGYRQRRGEVPHTPMNPDVMKRGGEGTDVFGRKMGDGPMPMRKGEMPAESLEDTANGIISNIRSFAALGLTGTTGIPDPELKAKILELAPDLADRIS